MGHLILKDDTVTIETFLKRKPLPSILNKTVEKTVSAFCINQPVYNTCTSMFMYHYRTIHATAATNSVLSH